MKKIYASLALLVNCALLSAAVPATHPAISAESVSQTGALLPTIGDNTITFHESLPYDNRSITPARVPGKNPARVSVNESYFDFDTDLLMGNTSRILASTEDRKSYWTTIGMIGYSIPVEGQVNTYRMSCFNPFPGQIQSIVAMGTVDPNTGIFTIDNNQVVGEVTLGNATYKLYLKAMRVNASGNMEVDPDAPVEFELSEYALLQKNESILLSAEVTPGKWSFLTAYAQGCLGVSTGVGYHTLTRSGSSGQVSEQTSYTMFAYPYDGKHLGVINAFNFGQFEFETVGTLDEGYLVYNDQTIWTMYDGEDPYPLVIYPRSGPSVDGEIEYIGNDATKITFDPLVAVIEYNGQLLIQASFTGYDASASGPEWFLYYNLETQMAFTSQIESDDANLPVEYYTLQGVKVANPANGIYLRRQGSKTVKVAIR